MKILILGAGQVGRTAAQALAREEANEVTVVDINEEVLRDLQDRLDVRTVAGNAAHPTVLEAAGGAEADIIVALTSSDEVQPRAPATWRSRCFVPRPRSPAARARIRLARPGALRTDGLSVDVIISPEQLVTEYVERLIHHPARCRCSTSPTARCAWSACAPAAAAFWSGTRCVSCPSTCRTSSCAWWRSTATARACGRNGDTIISEGDEVFFLAAREDPPRHGGDAPRR